MKPTPRPPLKVLCFLSFLALAALLAGCGQSQVEKALDSDANGYLCANCGAKFYTDRDVFAGHCPQCKQPNIQQVVGYICSHDQQMTLGARGRAAVVCSKCGKPTSGLGIPREKDFNAWGAAKKRAAEVGG